MLDGQFYPRQPIQFEPVRPWYRAEGVNFDGTNDYLTRGAGLTNAVDGAITVSFWIKAGGISAGAQRILRAVTAAGGNTARLSITIEDQDLNSNTFSWAGLNTAGSILWNIISDTNVLDPTAWKNVLLSIDASSGSATRRMYVGDTDVEGGSPSFLNGTLDTTIGDWYIGHGSAGANKLQGDLADFLLWTGTYLDFSVAANRNLFHSTLGYPLQPSVAVAVLGTPDINLSGPIASWQSNLGDGGAFTVTGALTQSTNSPSN